MHRKVSHRKCVPQVRARIMVHNNMWEHAQLGCAQLREEVSDAQHYLAIAEDAGVAIEAPAHAVKTAAPGRARHVRTVAPGGA